MSQFREKIRQSPEFQAATEAGEEAVTDSPVQAAQPVLQLEKTDVQMWADVLTVLLLFLIWRELARGGR